MGVTNQLLAGMILQTVPSVPRLCWLTSSTKDCTVVQSLFGQESFFSDALPVHALAVPLFCSDRLSYDPTNKLCHSLGNQHACSRLLPSGPWLINRGTGHFSRCTLWKSASAFSLLFTLLLCCGSNYQEARILTSIVADRRAAVAMRHSDKKIEESMRMLITRFLADGEGRRSVSA